MKNLSISLAIAVVVSFSINHAQAAFTFTGAHTDKLVLDTESYTYGVWGSGSSSITGTVNFKGFDPSVFTPDNDVAILLENGGSGGIYFNLTDATISGTADKPVITYVNSVDSLLSTENTKVKLAFTSNSMTATITTDYDPFELEVTPNGKITKNATSLIVYVGSMAVDTTLFLSGTSSTSTKNMGDYGTFDLTTVKLTGAADTTPPTVTILSPINKFKSTEPLLAVSGSVKEANTLSNVVFFCTNSPVLTGNEEFSAAELTASNAWKASASLSPGTNYIFVKAMDGAENWSTPVSRTFYYAKMSALALETEGIGSVTGVSNGQALEEGRGYKATAKPGNGYIFRGWKDSNGNYLSSSSAYTFMMSEGLKLRAVFIPNPFIQAKGTYTGLFYGYDATGTNLIPTNSGMLSLTVTTNGTYSGKATLLAGTYSFTGQLTLTGDDTNTANAILSIKRVKMPNLEASLACDLTGSGTLTGTVWQTIIAAGITNTLTAQYYGLAASPVKPSAAVLYNVVMTGATDLTTGLTTEEANLKMGPGYGSINIDKNNNVRFSFSLPDTTPAFLSTTSLNLSNSFPVFSPLYAKAGVYMGWMSAVSSETADYQSANTVWIRPASKTPKLYTGGFALSPTTVAAAYIAPKTGTNILGWTNGIFQWGGSLNSLGITNGISFQKNAFTCPDGNPNQIKMTLVPATGIITGTYGTTKPATSFKAVILPKAKMAVGFSTGTTQTDWVLLYPKE